MSLHTSWWCSSQMAPCSGILTAAQTNHNLAKDAPHCVTSKSELAFTRAAEGLGVAALLEPEVVARFEQQYCTVLY